MNSMDERWNNCARAARTAPLETPPPVPHGFVARAMRSARNDTMDLWAALSRRALAFAAMAILLTASVLWWQEPGDMIASPAVADEAIQQVLWQP